MATKKWFVIMRQEEIEKFENAYERLTYEAIKSFCGNGKLQTACSTREIAKRATLSQTTVARYLPTLLLKKYIIQTGEENRIGGPIPIYKVSLIDSVSESGSITLSQESESPSSESESPVGIKRSKVKSNSRVVANFKSPELQNAIQKILQIKGLKARLKNNRLETLSGQVWTTVKDPTAYAKALPNGDSNGILIGPKTTEEEIRRQLKEKEGL